MSQKDEKDDGNCQHQSAHDLRHHLTGFLHLTAVADRHPLRQFDTFHHLLHPGSHFQGIFSDSQVSLHGSSVDSVATHYLSLLPRGHHIGYLPQRHISKSGSNRYQFVLHLNRQGTIRLLAFQLDGNVVIALPYISYRQPVSITHGKGRLQPQIGHA